MQIMNWHNQCKNVVIKRNEELAIIDDGGISGTATIIVEPFGVMWYFVVPKTSPQPSHYKGEVVKNGMRRDVMVKLHADARAQLYGAVLAENNNEYQCNLVVHHIGPRSQSKTLWKGVGKDTSKQIFNGMIKIEQQAKKANAFLETRVLLLSKYATSESKPELEISANDVKASHAATTGRMDDNQLFYLQSRGIEKNLAELMIVEGFLWGVLSQIPK